MKHTIRCICALLLALAMGTPGLSEAEAPATPEPTDTVLTFETAPATSAPEETPAPTPEPTPAPTPAIRPVEVVDSAIQDDGMLRVYLRSLNAPEQLHLTVAGSYAVSGDVTVRFDRNAAVTVSAADGQVYLSAGGMAVGMGPSVTLQRYQASGGENGLYIAEAPRHTLYLGDLTVSVNDEGGLRAVLNIQVEDYLYGVVAYEMSDAFPLEALKAQAVAARTYAMQRKSRASGRDYDVVDTTADQVFRGYDAQYANVIAAVDATRGLVGTWNGGYAVCYYTASNGGQTALASQIWGGTDSDGYLAMVDDPYDLENPRSLQNQVTITADGEGSAKLMELLKAALDPVMADAGYGAEDWQLARIDAVTPAEPAFEGSRMYRKLNFDVRVRLRSGAVEAAADLDAMAQSLARAAEDTEPSDWDAAPETQAAPALPTPEALAAGTPEPTLGVGDTSWQGLQANPDPEGWTLSREAYTVSLDVYDQIKDELSLGLNGSDYELISVETEYDAEGDAQAFTIIMRRFGHGVGMSQRGAQRMAGHYGMTWQEIVGFYYPGMAVERVQWPQAQLDDLAALPAMAAAATPAPTPTPAPLPELKEGEYYAVVTLESASSALNVRREPSTAATVVDKLAHDAGSSCPRRRTATAGSASIPPRSRAMSRPNTSVRNEGIRRIPSNEAMKAAILSGSFQI